METKQKRKVSIFSVLIFTLCTLLLAYAIFSAVNLTSQLKEAIAAGQLSLGDNLSDVLNYYMNSSFIYIIYIAILLSIWWIKPRLKTTPEPSAAEISIEDTVSDEDIEEVEGSDDELAGDDAERREESETDQTEDTGESSDDGKERE